MRHTSGLFLVTVALAGCATTAPSVRWFREDVHPVAVKGDRRLDQAKIWSGDSVVQWRAVVITRDSISGTPVQCESCRSALPTSAVDSLSVGYASGSGGPSSDDDHGTPWWTPLLIVALIFCP